MGFWEKNVSDLFVFFPLILSTVASQEQAKKQLWWWWRRWWEKNVFDPFIFFCDIVLSCIPRTSEGQALTMTIPTLMKTIMTLPPSRQRRPLRLAPSLALAHPSLAPPREWQPFAPCTPCCRPSLVLVRHKLHLYKVHRVLLGPFKSWEIDFSIKGLLSALIQPMGPFCLSGGPFHC